MPSGTRVFISHAHEDNQTCVPLTAALDAWEIPYYFDTSPVGAAPMLAPNIQQALTTSNVFLRVCTRHTSTSIPMSLESNAFRGLQAQRSGGKRVFINLILDTGYQREPFDNATLFIDATTRSRFDWLGDIARALGITTVGRHLSRRSALALGGAGAVALASATSAGVVLARNRPAAAPKGSRAHFIAGLSGQAKWTQATANGTTPAVTVAGSVAYVFSGDGVSALSPADGKALWKRGTVVSPGYPPIPAVVASGVIYVVDQQGIIWALNSKDGSIRWKASTDQDAVAAPAVTQNAVYLVEGDGLLHAYKVADGSPLWKADIGWGAIDSLAPPVAWPTPVVAANTIYIGSGDHHLYALNASDGSVKWTFLSRGRIFSSPAVADGRVYFGSEDANVYAVSATDGKLLWSYPADYDILSSPSVANGIVYIGSRDHYLYALDGQRGFAYWRSFAGDLNPTGDTSQDNTQSTLQGDPVNCLPAIGTDAVYATAGAFIYSFQITDGKRLWRFHSGAESRTTSPAFAGNVVLFGGDDKILYAVNV